MGFNVIELFQSYKIIMKIALATWYDLRNDRHKISQILDRKSKIWWTRQETINIRMKALFNYNLRYDPILAL